MHEDFLGETFKNPFVLEGFESCHSIDWVPVQTQVDKVEEFKILALFEHILKRFSVRKATSTS